MTQDPEDVIPAKEEVLNSLTMLRVIASGLLDVRGIVMRSHIEVLETYIKKLESE